MRRLGSLVTRVADEVRVPAGSALAVDRDLFARRMTRGDRGAAARHASTARRCTASPTTRVDDPRHRAAHRRRAGRRRGGLRRPERTSTSTTPSARSSTPTRSTSTTAFRASRYGKGGDDYLNCPLDAAQYDAFYDGAHGCGVRDAARLRARALLRGLPAGRGDRLARPRHAALRADEAGGPRRPAHRAAAATRWCSCARTTSRPATGRSSASRPSSSGASSSGSSA